MYINVFCYSNDRATLLRTLELALKEVYQLAAHQSATIILNDINNSVIEIDQGTAHETFCDLLDAYEKSPK